MTDEAYEIEVLDEEIERLRMAIQLHRLRTLNNPENHEEYSELLWAMLYN